jgi:hypothetical protein
VLHWDFDLRLVVLVPAVVEQVVVLVAVAKFEPMQELPLLELPLLRLSPSQEESMS